MAVLDYVSPQVTDAVTQTNVKVVAEAPAMAMGSLYQAMSHSSGIMFENSVGNQNLQNMTAQAITTQGVMQIYSVDTVADSIAIARMLNASTGTR